MTNSTRYKLSIFSTILLTITGVTMYIYDPTYMDKFAFYTINMVLPIISYIIGRTIRGGTESEGLMQKSTRYQTSLYSFIISLIIGIVGYILNPENIDKLGMYMIGVVLPVVGYIMGRSFKGESDSENYDEP